MCTIIGWDKLILQIRSLIRTGLTTGCAISSGGIPSSGGASKSFLQVHTFSTTKCWNRLKQVQRVTKSFRNWLQCHGLIRWILVVMEGVKAQAIVLAYQQLFLMRLAPLVESKRRNIWTTRHLIHKKLGWGTGWIYSLTTGRIRQQKTSQGMRKIVSFFLGYKEQDSEHQEHGTL